MKFLILLQIFGLCCCNSIVKAYLDAVAKYGSVDSSAQSYHSSGGYADSVGSTLNMVDKDHFLAFKRIKEEIDYINTHDDVPFSASINQFSIMTEPERKMYTGLNASMMFEEESDFDEPVLMSSNLKAKLPNSIDWVERGAQVPIKHQGQCGSCWAYAGVSAIEAGYFLATGVLKSFSEQEVLDCTYEGKNKRTGKPVDGCDGGWLDNPMKYVKKADRLASVKDAPYLGKDMTCRYQNVRNSLTKAKVVRIEKFRGDDGLKEAVSRGVVSVAVALPSSFYSYSEGIYRDPDGCRGTVAHAITMVGYGKSGGMNFWRARNSWGTEWGDKGYIRYTRDEPNYCSMSMRVVLPILECRDRRSCRDSEEDSDKPDFKKKCANIWPDSFCNRSARYCQKQVVGREAEFQTKIREVCKKSCKLCD